MEEGDDAEEGDEAEEEAAVGGLKKRIETLSSHLHSR